ncbi:hypothetical protein FGW37_05375 [Streptomyces rectiverticillatus]|uniref:hypothetical protein n=1 Tax=Streptomyces rectiverticillatus TaxID=173860 RepID=UPI0015C3A3FD|nr:hypothetical protein [Streptomyces rectiverticillatus]QLE71109.1 hypothetical protein FGW37_05375 [Streptomyces rectiverticillatus]
MNRDPVAFLVKYLRSLNAYPANAVTGDLVGREPGQTTIYLEHSGGFRMVRYRMDRADIEYDVYHLDREQAARLAHDLRARLLEEAPGTAVDGVLVLDVAEISSPRYYPDTTSREHVYGGEISVFYTDA